MTRYQIVTIDSYRVIARGFRTAIGANNWLNAHDYGQFENEGGLVIVSYQAE